MSAFFNFWVKLIGAVNLVQLILVQIYFRLIQNLKMLMIVIIILVTEKPEETEIPCREIDKMIFWNRNLAKKAAKWKQMVIDLIYF